MTRGDIVSTVKAIRAAATLDYAVDLAIERLVKPATPDDVEHAIRAYLWRWHGHTALYGDDGELQCNECAPTWDYKRAPLADVVAAATAARFALVQRTET